MRPSSFNRNRGLGGALAAAVTLLAAAVPTVVPATADAQIYFQPPRVHVQFRPFWQRPRVVFVPGGRVMAPQPYCCAPPPPVYVQPQPQPYCCAPPPPVYVQPQPQPPVYAPPMPPPPVYVQPQPPPVYAPPPPPPVYAPAPPPVIVPNPGANVGLGYGQPLPPPVVLRQPTLSAKPQWRSKVGLGVRFAGILNTDRITQSSQLGFGGELLFRVARHLSLEVAGEGQRTVDDGFARWNVPVTFGMRIHIGPPTWVVSPYLVIASGLTYANMDFLRAHDVAWYLEGQAGGGLEVRLGQHVALTGDIRGIGRVRMNQPAEAVAATTSINGKEFHPLANEGGVQFRLGAAIYF